MHVRLRVGLWLLGLFLLSSCFLAQVAPNSNGTDKPAAIESLQQVELPADLVIDHSTANEKEENELISRFSPIIETYIQESRHDRQLGLVPKSDRYFLGLADFQGHLKIRSLLKNENKINWLRSFDPAGFLQMVFIDRGQFDRLHYRFRKRPGRETVGEVRCYIFDVEPLPEARGPRFSGTIWVEDRDYAIVCFKGAYMPSTYLSPKTLENEYYLYFESWRTKVKPGLWLPSLIYSQELTGRFHFSGPSFKAQTHLWGYGLSQTSREIQMSRSLVEPPGAVKEGAAQNDRSPLEGLREWRHRIGSNVTESFEGMGILASSGSVERKIDTIINNFEIPNMVKRQIDLHCRILPTTNLAIFSVGDTIVLTRGLIDVTPNEATMYVILALGVSDALLPKPYEDQYGFSATLNLPPDELLKHFFLRNDKSEAREIAQRAAELLHQSRFSSSLAEAGVFLVQLQRQAKQLRHLISPQLRNEAFFMSQMMQTGPTVPRDIQNFGAQALDSSLEIDPWNGAVRLRDCVTSLLGSRSKRPFEVVSIPPCLNHSGKSSLTQ